MHTYFSARPSQSRLAIFALVASSMALTFASVASADRVVVVYGPAPPPPPPPRYVYYYEVESPYAFVLAGDLEGAIPVGVSRFIDGRDLASGIGFKLRVGEQIRVHSGFRVTPEFGYGYDHLFAANDTNNFDAWDMHRVFGGVRLSFGHVVAPVIYGHIGYGWRVTGDPAVSNEGGLAFDFGGALDFRIVPHFSFGPHIEYVTVDAQHYGPEWIAIGAHADIKF